MKQTFNYVDRMNNSIKQLFWDALWISRKRPLQLFFLFKTIFWQRKAARVRADWEKKNIHVPPLMITSITNRCNLQCKGCYNMAQHRSREKEMTKENMRSVIEQAIELGISIILLAGGEPLVRREILNITRDFPYVIFPVFTNGLLIDEALVQQLGKQKNIVPVISMEGHQGETDDRRGEGVYRQLQNVLSRLDKHKIFYGTSITMTRFNFDTVTGVPFIQKLINNGCKLFFFVEYVPVKEGTEHLILTQRQREKVLGLMEELRLSFPGLFIAFPGDEEAFGGCLSAGRGFIHISADGSVEPCPFAPYSKHNLKNLTLKQALQSEFLKTIHQHHDKLSETNGGCALWENRKWVQSLLEERNNISNMGQHSSELNE